MIKKNPCKHLKTKQKTKPTIGIRTTNKQTKKNLRKKKMNEIDTKSVNPTENIDFG